jgi:DNA polymerase III gamma/tau subunit
MEKELLDNWNVSYRPRTFEEVAGNDTLKKTFKELAATGKWPKGMILSAFPGSGKTTFALIAAKYMSCSNPNEDGSPCNNCPDCRAVDNATFTRDVDLLDANDKASMSASEARDYVARFTSTPPQRGMAKVMIVDEAGKLSKEAISAFLKPLESPREGFYYIFTTMETLGSDVSSVALQRRCRTYKMTPPTADKIYAYLADFCKKHELTKTEGVPKSFWTEVLGFISKNCKQSFGIAIKMMETAWYGKLYTVDEVVDAMPVQDEESLNKALDSLCSGELDKKLIKSTLLEASDFTECFNFALYRLVQGKIAKAFGKQEDDDWRMAVGRRLAGLPYYDVVLKHYNALSDASTQYLRKNRYQEMIADCVIEIESKGPFNQQQENMTVSPLKAAPIRRTVKK